MIDYLTTLLDIAQSSIPATGIEDMNLSSYIAYLTKMNVVCIPSIEDDPNYDNRINMYTYLRDELGCETYGKAMGSIRKRDVKPSIMGVWVDEGFIDYEELQNVVLEGYPEFKDIFEKQWQDFCNTSPDCDIS